jgi:plasmid maintenance system antidote protein VapI
MTPNHRNWQHLGNILTARIQQLGYRGLPLHGTMERVSGTYVTFLLSGRAKLRFEYVKPIAQVLDLDEDQLFWTALEGMLELEDVAYFREYFSRLKRRKKKKKKE